MSVSNGQYIPDHPQNPNSQLQPQQGTPRARILNEAMKITHHDRNANYGSPEDNFQNIANLWNDYLKVSRPMAAVLTSMDVAVMSMLIKVARLGNNPNHRDSIVDIAGYAACAGDIQEKNIGLMSAAGSAGCQQSQASMHEHARMHQSGNPTSDLAPPNNLVPY